MIEPKEFEINNGIRVVFYSDGSGFRFFKNGNEIHFGVNVMQGIINAYNKYREELKRHNQLHDNVKVIKAIEY